MYVLVLQVVIIKPMTSCPTSPERFLICRGFLGCKSILTEVRIYIYIYSYFQHTVRAIKNVPFDGQTTSTLLLFIIHSILAPTYSLSPRNSRYIRMNAKAFLLCKWTCTCTHVLLVSEHELDQDGLVNMLKEKSFLTVPNAAAHLHCTVMNDMKASL